MIRTKPQPAKKVLHAIRVTAVCSEGNAGACCLVKGDTVLRKMCKYFMSVQILINALMKIRITSKGKLGFDEEFEQFPSCEGNIPICANI